jgi:hypothetical protein
MWLSVSQQQDAAASPASVFHTWWNSVLALVVCVTSFCLPARLCMPRQPHGSVPKGSCWACCSAPRSTVTSWHSSVGQPTQAAMPYRRCYPANPPLSECSGARYNSTTHDRHMRFSKCLCAEMYQHCLLYRQLCCLAPGGYCTSAAAAAAAC